MYNRLIRLLQVEKNEVQKLAPLFFFSFFSGIFISIFFSVSNSEFIVEYGKDSLPLAYLLGGLVGYVVVLAYSFIIKKSPA